MATVTRALGLSLLGLLAGCDRGCDRGCTEARRARDAGLPRDVPHDLSGGAAHTMSAECVREISHAALGHPSGTGAIDTLSVACDSAEMVVWALRGHVLSRTARALTPGRGFTAATVLAQGADRLGPVDERAVRGPVAWRSPTSDIAEALERDTVWAGVVRASDGGEEALRAALTMPAGIAGLGVVVPLGFAGSPLGVLASHGGEDSPPAVFRHTLPMEPRGAAELAAMPSPAWEGELDAYEFSRGTALLREHVNDGASFVAWRAGVSQRIVTRGPLTTVAPRGVRVGEASVFLQADFRVGRPDSGRCMGLNEAVCIEPGALSLVVVRDDGVRQIPVDSQGVPDSIAADARGVVAMFVSVDAHREPVQRAVRIDLGSGTVTELTLSPPEGMPGIDRPSLVTCGDRIWLAAEVSAPESSVTALPLECLLGE